VIAAADTSELLLGMAKALKREAEETSDGREIEAMLHCLAAVLLDAYEACTGTDCS